jgi:hypothetical protein
VRNERRSQINAASNALPESLVSLARGGVAPHIIIRSPRVRPAEFESCAAERLLQHYRLKSGLREVVQGPQAGHRCVVRVGRPDYTEGPRPLQRVTAGIGWVGRLSRRSLMPSCRASAGVSAHIRIPGQAIRRTWIHSLLAAPPPPTLSLKREGGGAGRSFTSATPCPPHLVQGGARGAL